MNKKIEDKKETKPLKTESVKKDKVVEKPRQIQNKSASMEAMRKYLNIEFPEILKNHNLNIIKKRLVKSTWINGVEITVSPDVVFVFDYNVLQAVRERV